MSRRIMKELWIAVPLVWLSLLQTRADGAFKASGNAAQELPAGVPRTVNTNGELINIDFMFTTPAYQEAAFELVVREANQVASDLDLLESRPITESDIVHAFVC